MRRSLRVAAHGLALCSCSLLGASANAQGALGNQGFGYPTGQLSAAALGQGGSNAEADPASPINPAAIALNGRYSVLIQFEPEFRSTKAGGAASSNSIMRFPGFTATGKYARFTVAASFSTLLDRTWVNSYDDSIVVDGSWEQSSVRTGSNGAMTDSRLAVAYDLRRRVWVGLALHAVTGENRTEFRRTFADTSGLASLAQAGVLNFSGRAVSAGVVLLPRDGLILAASMRLGGDISARLNGVSAGSATVPTRWGASASWLVLPGATLNARVDRTHWSDLDGLGSALVSTFDATEVGLGADLLGPRLGGTATILRLGARNRTLPFGVNGAQVSEKGLSFGAAAPLARGRGQIDVALQRAWRESGAATERSWFLSVGIGIRP